MDVVSDVACPWCYIGISRLLNACSQLRLTPSLRLHPYMIDLRTAAQGEDYLAYNERRWGGDGWTSSMRSSAKKDGGCDFKKWKVWPNTMQCHRVLEWAADKLGNDAQLKLKMALCEACYEFGENVSTVEGVTNVVARCFDETTAANVKEWLSNSNSYVEQVKQADRAAKERGIGGVPCFELDGVRVAEGAQSTQFWLRVLQLRLAASQR